MLDSQKRGPVPVLILANETCVEKYDFDPNRDKTVFVETVWKIFFPIQSDKRKHKYNLKSTFALDGSLTEFYTKGVVLSILRIVDFSKLGRFCLRRGIEHGEHSSRYPG